MSLFLKCVNGSKVERPPIWFMRQAGRYLTEYRNTRKSAGSFLELCYNSDLATEVTLQPIDRFGFDAAILFADILLLLDALGVKVQFIEGQGPILEPVKNKRDIQKISNIQRIHENLSPVYETVKKLKKQLPTETPLIGFAGAPWTLYRYMTGNNDASKIDPFDGIEDIQKLTNLVIEHLSKQIEAGCDTVQIFDSWAGDLGDDHLIDYCFDPIAKIVETIRERHPDVGIIAFPRLIGNEIKNFSIWTDPDLSLIHI